MRYWFALSLLAFLFSDSYVIAASGTFPAQPFNGMQITYSISGAQITQAKDRPGFTTSRTLQGKLGHGNLIVSGTVSQKNGYGATVSIRIRAGKNTKTKKISLKVKEKKSFSLSVRIGTTAANGEFSINMTGHYNAGTRGLVVGGKLSMLSSTSGLQHDRNPPPHKLSANGALAKIMKLYHRRIGRGIVGSGKLNNVLSLFSEKFGPYACGSYQAKVLAFLDSLRFSKDPHERALVEHFDYGPIHSYGGWHQAVVLYPKGKNWVKSGIVLDPWPEQKPKRYSMAEWSMKFSAGSYHGIGGADVYKKNPQYPTVGGYYVNPKMKKLTHAEQAWVRSLPPNKKAQLKAFRDNNARKLWIKQAYAKRRTNQKTVVQCPVDAYLKDPRGRISGFRNGRFYRQIPNVYVGRLKKTHHSYWTELQYPHDAALSLYLQGKARGKATVFRKLRNGQVTRYTTQVANRSQMQLSLRSEKSSMTGSLGQIRPQFATIYDARHSDRLKVNTTVQKPINPPAPHHVPYHTHAPQNHHAQSKRFFNIGNKYGVYNIPRRPTKFTINYSMVIRKITTYHWNYGKGYPPGQISLRHHGGRVYGPFQAVGRPGQGHVPNAYWDCNLFLRLPPGTYTVIDSHPQSWAQNRMSAHRGFVEVHGYPVNTPIRRPKPRYNHRSRRVPPPINPSMGTEIR